MYSNEITAIAGANKKRNRVGRGKGSGHGKTSGRGSNGAKSRAGCAIPLTYEGGQMPLFRRLPKRGFNNANFTARYEIVNVEQLEKRFEEGSVVGIGDLLKAGLVDNPDNRVKILGDGELTKKLTVSAHKFSKSAEQKIQSCGGTAQVVS